MEYTILNNKIFISGYENGDYLEGIYSDDGSGRSLEEQAQEIVDRKTGDAKQIAKDRVRLGFVNEFSCGKVESSLGFPVDARRSGLKNDLQNIEALIDVGATEIKDANGVMQTVSIDELKTIKSEIQQHALSIYQKKWDLEERIESAVTDEDLNMIRW